MLVTGAGGSIGSGCVGRSCCAPKRLLLLGISEIAFTTSRRNSALEAPAQNLHRARCITSVTRITNIAFARSSQTYGVQTVYHAAAYKHVPIVEQNIDRGRFITTSIATWHAAEAAARDTVSRRSCWFPLTRRVNPTECHGCDQALRRARAAGACRSAVPQTRFCMVRFGNVLEPRRARSCPLFHEQIRRGGPVTVTHPDVIRYFMTIPEAAQLVIQAGSMAKGGDVFVLDMGQAGPHR